MGGRFKREGIYVNLQMIHFIVQQELTQLHSNGGKNEDEMTEWCHLFSGHEFEQTPGDSKG